MHIQSFPALSRMTLVIGLAFSSLGAAQAADIASASASVSGLRYRLIDLDLNDGITPSLSVGGSLLASGYTSVKNESGYVDYNPQDFGRSESAPWFSGGTLSFRSGAPGASATLGSTLTTSTQVTSEALLANITSSTLRRNYVETGYDPALNDGILRKTLTNYTTESEATRLDQGAWINQKYPEIMSEPDELGSTYPVSPPNLTISANTLLVLEGTFSVTTSADSQAFASFFNSALGTPASGGRRDASATVNASASIGIFPVSRDQLFWPGVSTSNPINYVTQSLDNSLNYDLDQVAQKFGSVLGTRGTSTDSQNFALTLSNANNTELRAYLRLSVETTSGLVAARSVTTITTTYGDAVPVTPVPSIPEPSTYALMGLGLVGIVLARRRLRPTQAA